MYLISKKNYSKLICFNKIIFLFRNGCSFNEAQLIPYLIDSQEKIPQSFVPSDFHFLLLYNNCLQILSSINGQLIEQIDFQSENEKPIGLFRDPLKQTLFIYTLKSIYHVFINYSF